jgi:CheY-like chemotaxis protein
MEPFDLEVSMPITIVLAIGFDPWSFEAQRSAWRSAGFFVTAAGPDKEALDQFRGGDFDLVFLNQSIPAANREKLISEIRASGSAIPVIAIANSPLNADAFAFRTDMDESNALLRNIGEAVQTRKPPVRAVGKPRHDTSINWPLSA